MSAIGLQCNPSAPDPRPSCTDDADSLARVLEGAGWPDYLAAWAAFLHTTGWQESDLREFGEYLKRDVTQFASERDRRAA